ncbi:MAG: hypothetical protein MMC33_003667 [Icmadophila ericetorum]|nr:hypothetical protein [Icmadophila ericetorum]
MTDSPAVYAWLDPKEQPILDAILSLRDKLSLLKQDRSTYIKSHDVLALYDELVEQVHQLNDIRKAHHKALEQNRVDYVLDDCFQLISLFFLTIGRNNEAPAVYSMTSTIKRLLDHLEEAALYTAKDLDSIEQTFAQMRDSIQRGKETYSPHLLTLLENRIDTCHNILEELQARVSQIPPDLREVHEKMISIIRSLSAANTKSNFPRADVLGLQEQLKEIGATMKDGKFIGPDGTVPENQQMVIDLFHRCTLWSELVLERQGNVDERFAPVYEKLRNIRDKLDRLSLTQAWSLRETDLYSYQRQLDRIDESRVGGNFEDPTGYKADLHAQRTLLYLLRRSYATIYSLIISSEPVSEALLPVYNQLQTLRRCLLEVKKNGGVSSPRELYPYSMKLNSIDNMRVDGKFLVGSDIPEGQASVNALLADCFEVAYELRVEAEEHDESE